jgi:hypothetical protein
VKKFVDRAEEVVHSLTSRALTRQGIIAQPPPTYGLFGLMVLTSSAYLRNGGISRFAHLNRGANPYIRKFRMISGIMSMKT